MSPETKHEKAVQAAKERCEENAEVIERITQSLEVAQRDLSSLGGSIGAGVGDLRKDVSRLIKDARRDVKKMGTATRKDLLRLQRDLAKSASGGNGAHPKGGASGDGEASRSSRRGPGAGSGRQSTASRGSAGSGGRAGTTGSGGAPAGGRGRGGTKASS